MSVYKFCVFMVCVRILVDFISVFVIRVGWVCSVIKVMDYLIILEIVKVLK